MPILFNSGIITKLGDSLKSSVLGLNVTPKNATFFPLYGFFNSFLTFLPY